MRALSSLADDDRKIEGAILTTYPFDTEFYEGAVRRIVSRKKGVGSDNVILVDSSKYRETFKRDVKPRYAGRRYYLSPVSVDGKRVFHPKMFFFAGQKRAYCFVGSANLTQRGLTHNAELWSHFASERKEEGEESTQRQSLILRDLREFLLDLFDTQYTDMIGRTRL
jgi:phosphatidylserine/phosphatidylglycerophosphate/cardiolipin synthase-like enzyme